MHTLRIILVLMLIGTATVAAQGQEELRLGGAIQLALKQNPTVLAARSEVDAADANVRGARALANPEVVITPSVIGESGSDTELLAVQPLEVSGRRQIRTRIASSEAQATRARVQVIEREIIRDVKQAYWAIAEAQAVVELNQANVALAESLYDASKRQVDVGVVAGSQAIKAQVELARARQDMITAEVELVKARIALNTLLGRRPDTEFTFADTLMFTPVTEAPNRFRAIAAANRPELAEAQALLAVRRQEIQAAIALRRPDLAVQARQETFGGEGGLGIGLTFPLFDWGSIREGKKQAQAFARAQEKRVEATRNAVDLEVESALLDVRRTEEQVRQYEGGLLSQSEQLAEMAQKGYRAGATGYLEVLEAQRTLKNVRTLYFQTLADHQRSVAQLEWAVGTELTDVSSQGVTP